MKKSGIGFKLNLLIDLAVLLGHKLKKTERAFELCTIEENKGVGKIRKNCVLLLKRD